MPRHSHDASADHPGHDVVLSRRVSRRGRVVSRVRALALVAGTSTSEMSEALRIATRGSELALRRVRAVQAMLAAQGSESEIATFKTSGDKLFDDWLSAASSRAVFTRELENALVKNKADIAVHAVSDMPTDAL